MTVKIINEHEKNALVNQYKMHVYSNVELADIYNISTDTVRRVLRERGVIPAAKPKAVKSTTANTGYVSRNFQWAASSKFISITEGRKTWNADNSHPGFKAALQKLVDNDIEGAIDSINIEQSFTKFVKGNIKIENGVLYFKDIALKTSLTERIISSMEKGEEFEFYLPFLENLMENPSRRAVYRLFDFLSANDIEITSDGHFIAWKVVRDNYFDCASGTFDNSPGKTVTMPRNMVDEDDQRTCSAGLHVCSKSYIGSFAYRSNKVVSVKVHPRDVVSVPVDYNDAKMRTCGYVVVEDVTERWSSEF